MAPQWTVNRFLGKCVCSLCWAFLSRPCSQWPVCGCNLLLLCAEQCKYSSVLWQRGGKWLSVGLLVQKWNKTEWKGVEGGCNWAAWPVECEAALSAEGRNVEMESGFCSGGTFEYPASFPGFPDIHSSPHHIWREQWFIFHVHGLPCGHLLNVFWEALPCSHVLRGPFDLLRGGFGGFGKAKERIRAVYFMHFVICPCFPSCF